MEGHRILIVDDEKNIRLTVAAALEGAGFEVDTARDGAEALDKLDVETYWLVLLDIKMPGMDGMEVLRRLRDVRPEVRVVMITAHGDVESAVEAMKLGAVDFLPKPFSPGEIRGIVQKIRDREALDPEQAEGYDSFVELARRGIARRQLDDARGYVRKALAADEGRPEAHNLLGVLHEIEGERYEAQERYRKALAADPTYAPARANLGASTEPKRHENFILDEAKVRRDTPEHRG